MHPLDHVIWHALTTRQAQLGDRLDAACKFHHEVSLLGAVAEPTEAAYASLARLLTVGQRVGLFMAEDVATRELEIVSSAPVLQMVGALRTVPAVADDALVALTLRDRTEMMALTQLTQPGPFHPRTPEMGDYFGIRRDGALVAMAGERLRVPGHTEISAVCTHPDHVGRGHAAALTTLMMRRIIARNERPFLHVRPENTRAVGLYERLGFERRLESRYVILQRPTT